MRSTKSSARYTLKTIWQSLEKIQQKTTFQLYQECHIHYIVITSDEGWEGGGGDRIGAGWLIYIRVWVGGQGACIIL